MSAKSTEWLHRSILLASSVAGALLLSELVLRAASVEDPVFSRPDDERGWVLRPGARGRFEAEGGFFVVINADGRRDRARARTKAPGVFRIAVLGDSFTEALEVPLEQTFVSVLEDSLNRSSAMRGRQVEVLNFGVRGYGTAQELLTLRCCVWDYSPDFVLLAFFSGNDVPDNSPTLDRSATRYARPYLRETSMGWEADRSFRRSWRYRGAKLVAPLVAHSRVLQLIIRGQHLLGHKKPPSINDASEIDSSDFGSNIYREPKDEAWREAWRMTEDLVTTMAREVSERGSRFAVVNVPIASQVYPNPDIRERFVRLLGVNDLLLPARRIRALGDRAGFPVLDLTADLQGYADQHRAFLHGTRGNGHWNRLGHRLAGEKLASWVAGLIAENR